MYPIILCHGVCRFDNVWKDALQSDNNDKLNIDDCHYFKGVRTMLQNKGFEVWHSDVPWGASVRQRAISLKQNIRNVLSKGPRCNKVHLIAHSMGGLDARHMMFDDRSNGRIHEHIASLTTISTPHNGSAFADWGTEHLLEVLHIAQALGLDLKALWDLRTDRCREFNGNRDVIDFENELSQTTRLQTYAGRQELDSVFWPLVVPHRIISEQEGPNDGLVSVESAKWNERYFVKELPQTDHLNELGWWDLSQFSAGESAAELLQRIHSLYVEIASGLQDL
ncbi:MAG TPA: hypothetical protein PKM59_08110 [Thermodesulfobacteriota bacterium]|nr:hypothetical protein [Thermodesulfobacteriota bacterium]HNU72761.1 hypothetical protein [Thermodesulfobacteriota bacterium]